MKMLNIRCLLILLVFMTFDVVVLRADVIPVTYGAYIEAGVPDQYSVSYDSGTTQAGAFGDGYGLRYQYTGFTLNLTGITKPITSVQFEGTGVFEYPEPSGGVTLSTGVSIDPTTYKPSSVGVLAFGGIYYAGEQPFNGTIDEEGNSAFLTLLNAHLGSTVQVYGIYSGFGRVEGYTPKFVINQPQVPEPGSGLLFLFAMALSSVPLVLCGRRAV